MITWRRGEVLAVRREWRGAVELTVRQVDGDTDGGAGGASGAPEFRALAYPELVGRPEVGDTVLLNTTAQTMGLGTGGYALVTAIPDRLPADPERGPGHLVKGRYTPLQAVVLGVDEQDSPHHAVLRDADDLDAMPVVIADLHSALPAVCAGVRAVRPEARIAYVMTDGGALPAWFSMTVSALRDADWIVGTVTTGQAMGGDLEAVTVHSGLLAARQVLRADIAVVTQGPGNLGTDTRWGFSGVAAGEAVNAAAALGGRAVAALRISDADPRERHQGVSHHSLTAYGRVALAAADVVVPDLDEPLASQLAADVATLRARHRVVTVPVDGLDEALRTTPVKLSTMGRGLDEDHAHFVASAAAGRHAAALLPPPASP
ncbi:DUF3866 family protein [Streptodolium elevatio]|uniref:DUF3866 family protein n=1 Tax=Streptodolium elevatio TaxID=3157996 RepID=A0ABV3DVU0_9ACTN